MSDDLYIARLHRQLLLPFSTRIHMKFFEKFSRLISLSDQATAAL
jgi:hypothetical protein